MAAFRPTARAPRTRTERQRETREALVIAALEAFARDGYHGAGLDAIAREAGFSKGAVYSNFAGKSELFLAVMDFNLEMLRGAGWDPLASDETPSSPAGVRMPSGLDVADMVRGFGLATLEFIATAARDENLVGALRERVQVMVQSYERIAADDRPAGETLAVGDVAQLMAALDQGASVLALSGITSMDEMLLRAGLRRLVDPAGAAAEPALERDGSSGSFPGVDRVQQLFREAPEG